MKIGIIGAGNIDADGVRSAIAEASRECPAEFLANGSDA
jgi:hypothetical protein